MVPPNKIARPLALSVGTPGALTETAESRRTKQETHSPPPPLSQTQKVCVLTPSTSEQGVVGCNTERDKSR